MNRIKMFMNSFGRGTRVVVLSLAVIFVSAGIAQATSSTIGTDISTSGALTVSGLSSLGNASTTGAVSIAGDLTINGNATTTAAGAFSTQSTLGVLGLSTLTGGFVSQASSTVVGAVTVTGSTVLASTTVAGNGFKVGQLGTQMSLIQSGFCVTTSVTIPASPAGTASSTPTFVDCTPQPVGVLVTGSRVLVQATSSLPFYVVLQSASSTSLGNISIELVNTSTSTSPAARIYGFNFLAFQ